MRQHALHETLLFWGSEPHPYDVRPGQAGGYGGVVELLRRAVGELDEGHVRNLGVPRGKAGPELVQGLGAAAQKGHAVAAALHNIAEEPGAAVCGTAYAVEPAQIEGHPRAVANGEQAPRHGVAVAGVAVHAGQHIAVRHANVAGPALLHGVAQAAAHGGGVELVADLEVGFHVLWLQSVVALRPVAAQASGIGVLGEDGARGPPQGVRTLVNALALDDFVEGVEDDVCIEGEGEVANVAQVESDALAEGEVVAPLDLGEPGEAGADAHAPLSGVEGESVHMLGDPRARADEAHVADEDVEELGQLVEGGCAQQAAEPCGAILVREQFAVDPALVVHGAEFNDVERLAVHADAFLDEDGVAALQQNEQQGDEQQHGGKEQQGDEGAHDVRRAFEALRPKEARPA